MRPQPLDDDTAARLLQGRVAPDDAPPGYSRTAAMVRAALAPASPTELTRERETVAAMVAAVRALRPGPTRTPPGRSLTPRRLLAKVVLVSAVVALGGSALAATGGAPGDDLTSHAATRIARTGGSASSVQAHAGPHATSHATSHTTSHETGSKSPAAPDTKGSEISRLARTTDATGVDKGAVISTAASGGRSRADAAHPPASRPSDG